MLDDGTPRDPLDRERNGLPVFYWNWVGLEMNRIATGLMGPQGGPTLGSRALGLLHLAMHDAWFGCRGLPKPVPYVPSLKTFVGTTAPGQSRGLIAAEIALSAAAITVLGCLYRGQGRNIARTSHEAITGALDRLIREAPFDVDTLHAAYRYGECVAAEVLSMLMVKPGERGADQGSYEPREGRYYFRDEPLHPVRLQPIDPDHPERGSRAVRIYHAPYYGETVQSFAVTQPEKLSLKPPPCYEGGSPGGGTAEEKARYSAALEEVIRLGGAHDLASTQRKPGQTAAGLYWAYDGANLIGTPPRLYNQIIRVIAWDKRNPAEERAVQSDGFVRIFALCNAAMADAGKFAWREKYRFEFWRPLSGVREQDVVHDGGSGAEPVSEDGGPAAGVDGWDKAAGTLSVDALCDPLWRALGAPDTNSNKIAFKPPFPAYPSGHATFGAACFQMLRRYYADPMEQHMSGGGSHEQPDDIAFSFVSDEFNGVSRQLFQSYDPSQPITEQPGDVRTLLRRRFPSLKHAIFENAMSRIFLGVHWRYDAFSDYRPVGSEDPFEHSPDLPDPHTVSYGGLGNDGHGMAGEMTGGIPLGIAIANQIFDAGLSAPEHGAAGPCIQEAVVASSAVGIPREARFAVPESKISNTNLR